MLNHRSYYIEGRPGFYRIHYCTIITRYAYSIQTTQPRCFRGLIEDFVTRNGTDYGDIEISLETKIKQVMRQLKNAEVVIAYNHDEEYCNIITQEDARNILDQKKDHPI